MKKCILALLVAVTLVSVPLLSADTTCYTWSAELTKKAAPLLFDGRMNHEDIGSFNPFSDSNGEQNKGSDQYWNWVRSKVGVEKFNQAMGNMPMVSHYDAKSGNVVQYLAGWARFAFPVDKKFNRVYKEIVFGHPWAVYHHNFKGDIKNWEEGAYPDDPNVLCYRKSLLGVFVPLSLSNIVQDKVTDIKSYMQSRTASVKALNDLENAGKAPYINNAALSANLKESYRKYVHHLFTNDAPGCHAIYGEDDLFFVNCEYGSPVGVLCDKEMDGLSEKKVVDNYSDWKQLTFFSTTFDPVAYAYYNPDLWDLYGVDLFAYCNHFMEKGYTEGRQCAWTYEDSRYVFPEAVKALESGDLKNSAAFKPFITPFESNVPKRNWLYPAM